MSRVPFSASPYDGLHLAGDLYLVCVSEEEPELRREYNSDDLKKDAKGRTSYQTEGNFTIRLQTRDGKARADKRTKLYVRQKPENLELGGIYTNEGPVTVVPWEKDGRINFSLTAEKLKRYTPTAKAFEPGK